MFLSPKASNRRIQEAENARRNRQEIVEALSHGQVSRRDLFKWGLFTTVGGLALKHGLSPFANSAIASVPTGIPLSPLFGGLPFTQAMLRGDLLTRTPNPMTALSPAPMAQANEMLQNLDPALVAAYPGGSMGPIEGRPPETIWAHQRWNEFLLKIGVIVTQEGAKANMDYNLGVASNLNSGINPATSIPVRFHTNMPIQDVNTMWTFNGTVPPKLLLSRYGEPVLIRHHNKLPFDPKMNNGFARHTLSTHEHNGHHGAENDGVNLRLPSETAKDWGNLEYDVNLMLADKAFKRKRWGADHFPNVVLTTQHGKKVRLYDDLMKGKSVAFNTFFSGCGDVCPLGAAKRLELQKLLGDRAGRDIFFYSISIDPIHDTPESLKAYAGRFNIGPGWLFLTGSEKDVQIATKKLGLGTLQATAPRDNHSTTLMVGHEPSGQWMKNSVTDNPRFVAGSVQTFLGWPDLLQSQNYAQADLLQLTNGQFLFQNGCIACHSIGGGDKIGPDLLGITERRQRNWLEKFVLVPDEVLAAGDPVANELLKKYKGVRMPNLGFSRADVADILAHIETSTAKVRDRQALLAAASQPEPAGESDLGAGLPTTQQSTKFEDLNNQFKQLAKEAK